MWWKIYFWSVAILIVIGSFSILEYAPIAPIDIISIILEDAMLVGIFAYVYKRHILDKQYWKIIFYVIMSFLVIGLLEIYALPKDFIANLFPFLKSNIPLESEYALFGMILYIPAYYALYQLAFNKKIK